jgi:phosphoglycolate phosphatase
MTGGRRSKGGFHNPFMTPFADGARRQRVVSDAGSGQGDHVGPVISVVVFDLDGTLTDSEAGIVASYQYALVALGIRADDDAIRQEIGPPLVEGFASLGVPEVDLERAIMLYRKHFSSRGILENRLYPGVEDMLRALFDGGIRLGLATSKLDEYAHLIVRRLLIAGYFDLVTGSSRDGTRLHKEKVLDHTIRGLGVADPSMVAMVGHRAQDMFAAINCGARAVGATWGYGTANELLRAGAAHLISRPSELLNLIQCG